MTARTTGVARPAHGLAVAGMLLATLMWSMAGVVSRQLERAASFEATFWRSAVTVVALVVILLALRGSRGLVRSLRSGGKALWLSGACWAVMFTAFMLAITLTTVANVLVTMATAPLFTALMSRAVTRRALPLRTWGAVAAAGLGIAVMYVPELRVADARALAGMAIAFAVPLAAATNWTVIQWNAGRGRGDVDLLPAVLIGAVGSSLVTLVPAAPFHATGADIGWLALLGVGQLAVPCLVAVAAARHLSAPEAALLSLLEILFGVTWTWLGGYEQPGSTVLIGGALVIGALVANEALALRGRAATPGDVPVPMG